jgi:Ca2+-binding EF-hand superfamily protein
MDRDKDGLVTYKEFEQFYNQDFDQRIKEIEKEKHAVNMQYEIFDHLMKVLQ